MRASCRRLLVVLCALLAVAGTASARTLRQGTVSLHRCTGGAPGWCGAIRRPLDPGLAGGPMIPIAFEWVPARSRTAAASTIVAVEGGPGYPSSGTVSEYLGTFGPVLADHNLLLVDNRGTGRSALIRCRGLDRFPKAHRASGPAFDRLVGACGRALDHRYRTRSGRPIHAADLFGTMDATADLRAVLRRLRTGRVQLYGDSYGSWFAQVFATRYPGALRSVILDSTYSTVGLDPWYASSGISGRVAIDRVCARDPGCSADAGAGTPVSRLATLLSRIRARPISGTVTTVHARRSITITPRRLVDLFQDGGSDPLVWRELDASVRAALGGDPAPLLRLAVDGEDNGGVTDAEDFSNGDYMAVSCTDYPQLFSLTAPTARRSRELARSIRAEPAAVFRPFTPLEWTTMSGYSETYDSCLDWPVPVHRARQLPTRLRPLPASVPVLVVGGDLDDLTPLRDVRGFAPRLGRRVRVVDLHNTVHVTSEGDTYLTLGARCVRSILDRFVTRPDRLRHLDTACAAQIPHIHTPGAYPRTLSAAVPATIRSGPPVDMRVRRAVTVAAGALADTTIRQADTGDRLGVGLRGGTWIHLGHGRLRLRGVRFVDDATVSGPARYRSGDGATRGRLIVAARGLRVTIVLAWDQRSKFATGRVGSTRLRLPAP